LNQTIKYSMPKKHDDDQEQHFNIDEQTQLETLSLRAVQRIVKYSQLRQHRTLSKEHVSRVV
jgi:hypothetical protein